MTKRPVLAQGVQPKELGSAAAAALPSCPLSRVLKPKMLEEQQRRHVNRGPPGPAEQPGSIPVSQERLDAQLAQKGEP